jgi:hypothetical protein
LYWVAAALAFIGGAGKNADVGGDLGFGLGHNANGVTPYGFDQGGSFGIVLFRNLYSADECRRQSERGF